MTSHLSLSILCFPSCAMARLSGAGLGLLKCTLLLLGLSGGLCQHDCTGVDCPVLSHCIREVLESGACCPSCVKGCTCEGYQYYDCVNAGFQNGKVPEGDSYFVDYGSTECSCPEGGGRISCHYISCPEIPANCIEMSEPEDSCAQCERIGCVRDTQKFDAGHSFHVDPCRVCHCPSEGGELMCYSVPDCDPRGAGQSMPTAPTEHSIQYGDTYRFDQQSPPHGHPPSGNLPIFKPAPNDRMDLEDYDYEHADVPEFGDETPDFPTQSPPLGMAFPLSHGPDRAHRTPLAQGVGRGSKLELRERYGVHEHPTDRIQATESPAIAEYSVTTAAAHMRLSYSPPLHSPNGSRNHISTLQPLRTTNSQITPQVAIVRPMLTESSSDKIIFPLHRSSGSQNHPPFLLQRNPESSVHPQRTPERKKHTDNLVIPLNPLKGPESRPPSIHPVPEKEHQAHPVSHSITVKHPLHPLVGSPDALDPTQSPSHGQTLMQSAVAPDMHSPDEYSVDEEETEEEEEEEEERIVTLRESTPGPDGRDVPYRVKSHAEEEDERFSHSVAEGSPLEPSTESPRGTERPTTPAAVLLTTTAQPMLRAKVITQEEGHPGKRWPQTQFDPRGEDLQDVEEEEKEPREEEGSKDSSLFRPDPNGAADPGPGVSDGLLVEDCCVVGQRWATEKGHCSHMPPLSSDKLSICSVAQHQCCASSLKESLCVSGVASARAGEVCRVEAEDQCRDDSHQVCCSCCALGLRLRREGQGCSGHQYLGYPCGHIFLTCCEAEDGPGQVLLRRKEQPRPTAMPTEVPVSDRKFPKEAFSIDSTVDEKANVVDEEEDVDECQLYRGQLCQHICTNTWGSYLCSCHHGYVLQEDGHSCTSVSPGEDNRVREGDIHSIVPGPATTATTTTTSTPVYFNACTGGGPCSQQCTLMSGQATCSCFPGFSLTADKHTCEDVDECVTNTHSCGLRERCVNTVGSHMCERQLSCRPGYQPRHGVCEDIDECMVRIHNCGIGFECKNTEGSFLCKPKQKCLTGFKQDSHGNCIDINECSTLSESCSPGFNCINTVGSYTCQRKVIKCNHGYQPSPDGAKCIDVDECQMGTHRCGTEQICHNLPGSYSCDCRTGFQYDAIRQVCNDVNECWRYPGRLCAQTCENTPGSYQCTCTAGFSLAFDGKNCEDINECDRSPCSQECANIYGSYQCYCRQGFHLKEDGHTCEDIDECSQSIGNLCAFECVNVPGSYQCACPPHGYTKSANGRTCRDIDECTSQSHNCSHGQSCYNIQGSYRCLSYDCPPNYKKVSDTRCERLGCPGNSADCQSSPLRITYYQLNFQTNILTPAQVFRIGPSPAYSGDHIVIGITRGNEEGYFSTRKLNSFTGAVYLQRQVRQTKDFLIDVEMKLLRQGSVTSFVARIYVFITAGSP